MDNLADTWSTVAIEFLAPEAGGRTEPPTGPLYWCNWIGPDNGWSVVVDLAQQRLRFLVENAPHHLLVPGFRVAMQEGPKVVGYATVLGGSRT